MPFALCAARLRVGMTSRIITVDIISSKGFMKTKREKLFDKIVQVSENTDPDYAEKATRRNFAAYKACPSRSIKRDFMEHLPGEERTILRKWAEEKASRNAASRRFEASLRARPGRGK
jgi:hypothetical protein